MRWGPMPSTGRNPISRGRSPWEMSNVRMPAVKLVAHVQDREAVAEGLADVGIAAVHDDLNAVAAAALVRMAHERDVARRDGPHRARGSAQSPPASRPRGRHHLPVTPVSSVLELPPPRA